VTPQIATAGVFDAPPLQGNASVFAGDAMITAQAIVIRYRSSDFSVLDITPPATSAETPSSSGSTNSNSSSSHSGMSSGTKLAIGLGVSLPLAAIILAAIIFFFVAKRRKQQAADAVERPKSKDFVQTLSTSTINIADKGSPSIPPPELPNNRGE
jgi:hypothetical protein